MTLDQRLSIESLPPELPELDGKPADLPAAPAGVGREPSACRALSKPAPSPPRAACASRDDAVRLLAEALAIEPQTRARRELLRRTQLDWEALMRLERHRAELRALVERFTAEQQRDLHALERCQGFPPGFMRTVRAELERDCAETLAMPVLQRPPRGISAELLHTLRGLALSSRFVRAVPPSPVISEPVDAARIDAFVAGPLTRYREATAARLERVALALDALPAQSHGHAVALAGRAVAWHRLRSLRGQTLPDSLKKDYALRTRYFERVDALSSGLEDRVLPYTVEATAGAALHGLLRDRALQAHLSQIYGSSKRLWIHLPRSTPPLRLDNPWFRLASELPARYPAELLTPEELASERSLAELAPGGLSLRQKRFLVRAATGDDFRTLAELQLKLGLVLHRDEEIRESSRLAELVPKPSDEDSLVSAVSRDLLRASHHFDSPVAVSADFAPDALLRLAAAPDRASEIRAVASYDAAVLMAFSKQISTLQAAYRRLQAVQETVSDKVTRDCAVAFQHVLADSWRFKPVPRCSNWPWLDD